MKNAFSAMILSLALAGCSSYSEIARWDSDVTVNGGEVPLASFITQNFSYQIFGCIPLCTGLPWTEGIDDIKDEYDVKWFSNEATVDNNLRSVKHALGIIGSDRVTCLSTSEDNSWVWSLFIVRRHEVRTECIVLKKEAAH